jgi:cellulose biosynthesis protein BcsQ
MPMRPQINDLETVPNTLDLIATASRSRQGPIPTIALLGAVPAQGKRHKQTKAALERMGVQVCEHTIGHRAAFGDAAALGLTVLEHDHGKAAEEVRAVYRYMLALLEGRKPN